MEVDGWDDFPSHTLFFRGVALPKSVGSNLAMFVSDNPYPPWKLTQFMKKNIFSG